VVCPAIPPHMFRTDRDGKRVPVALASNSGWIGTLGAARPFPARLFFGKCALRGSRFISEAALP